MRNLNEVIMEIKKLIKEEGKNYYGAYYDEILNEIDKLLYSITYKPPEDMWSFTFDEFITGFIPPVTDLDYKALSIWTTRPVEELKKEVMEGEQRN